MKVVIYRKQDGVHVGTIPIHGTFKSELKLNVLPNFGGKEDDYATLDVPCDFFELKMVGGKVVAVETEPPQPTPTPPSKGDLMGMELAKIKLEIIQLKGGM